MADDIFDRMKTKTDSNNSIVTTGNDDIFDRFKVPTIKQPAPIRELSGPEQMLQSQEQGTFGKNNQPDASILRLPIDLGQGWLKSTGEHAANAVEGVKSGLSDIGTGRLATGVGKLGLGMIGYPLSPITGGLHEFVGKPAAKIGGQEFGDKAELLAGSSLPVGVSTRLIQKALPTNQAIRAITSSVAPADLAEGINRLKSNPRLSVMDVFPSVKQMGQKLILTEGTHQNKFTKFIEDRIGSRKGAVEDVFHDTVGAPPNVLLKLNQLKANIKDVGKEINPIVDSAGPVDMSGVISNIDAKLKPGITSIISAGEPLPLGDINKKLSYLRDFLTNDKSVRTDANSLHQFQSSIRTAAEDYANSPNPQDRQLGYALHNVRNDIVNAIDKAAPGYKEKLGRYREENQIQEAFDKGYSLTKNRPGQWDDRPEFWDEWVKNASKEEREAAKEGARVAFDDTVNGTRHAGRKGMDIPETPFNQEKIGLLFGKKEANDMASRLRDERDISKNNSDMIGNSQTAMRTKSNSKIFDQTEEAKKKNTSTTAQLALLAEAAGEYISGGAVPGLGALVMAPKAISFAKTKFIDTPLGHAKNNRLTDLLTSTGEDRNALIQMLESNLPQAKLSLSQKAKLLTGKP